MTSYDGVQTPSTRQFLSRWSNHYGWAAIFTSLLLPVIGVYLAAVSISFGSKRRDRIHGFPYISLLISLTLLFVHMWLWAKLIDAL